MACQAKDSATGIWIYSNVVARIVAPPPPSTKTFGLNSVEPGAPLVGGLAQDLGGFD